MHTVDTSPSNVGPFARLDMHNVCPFRTASGARIVSARSENLARHLAQIRFGAGLERLAPENTLNIKTCRRVVKLTRSWPLRQSSLRRIRRRSPK